MQIYCDFSAYSDIAIGVAALLGYRFQRNFNQPYRAETLADFWRRWHISLSTWLRDYLYIPLGGSRHGRMQDLPQSAADHGAGRHLARRRLELRDLGRAAWRHAGRSSGCSRRRAVPVPAWKASARPLWRRALAILLVFHFVCLCWIFFRADSATRAGEVMAGLANWSQPAKLLTPFLACLIAIGPGAVHRPDLLERLDRLYHRMPTWAVGVLAGLALLLIEVVGGDSTAPFIYFQF